MHGPLFQLLSPDLKAKFMLPQFHLHMAWWFKLYWGKSEMEYTHGNFSSGPIPILKGINVNAFEEILMWQQEFERFKKGICHLLTKKALKTTSVNFKKTVFHFSAVPTFQHSSIKCLYQIGYYRPGREEDRWVLRRWLFSSSNAD